MPDSNSAAPVSLFRRLMAIIYDSFLIIGLCMLVAGTISIVNTFIMNGGNAITDEHPLYLLHQIIILSTIFITGLFFYIYFWSRGGQTLGMKTWMLLLISDDGSNIDRKQATIRSLSAVLSWSVFGLGFLWSLIDSKNRTWHDILSSSHLVQLEKK
ncbi:MAG: RDD family protein [endosymbiont of Galathealinum brachiosum]|uniref:RDD family protein n=1 Tax=endosymbiont of Galathealinum brachiosum TaxID=2200906 RepID=A0A370DIY1_9GAMM|nr:MAG: RDD family protein [endosymbiont of Galathealinum brachiosum]